MLKLILIVLSKFVYMNRRHGNQDSKAHDRRDDNLLHYSHTVSLNYSSNNGLL